MSVNVVNDALKYYDSNNEKFKKVKKKIKYVKKIRQKNNSDVNLDSTQIVFYDEDKNELFTSRIEIIGKYYNDIKTWVWGWSLPNINKSLTTIIRKVFLYGTDINIDDNQSNVLLKHELVTSRFRIENDVQIDIHCAIASYLAKKPFIFMWNEFYYPTDVIKEFDDNNKKSTGVIYYTYIVDCPDI